MDRPTRTRAIQLLTVVISLLATGCTSTVTARTTTPATSAYVHSTPTELKTLVGGTAPATVDTEHGRVLLPVADGPTMFLDLATCLASSGVFVAGLALRRPTLDDVFLTLTQKRDSSAPHRSADDDAHARTLR